MLSHSAGFYGRWCPAAFVRCPPTSPHADIPLNSGSSVSGFLSVRGRWRNRISRGRSRTVMQLAGCSRVRIATQPVSLWGPKWLGLCPLLGWKSGLYVSALLSHHSGCSQVGVIVMKAGLSWRRPVRSQQLAVLRWPHAQGLGGDFYQIHLLKLAFAHIHSPPQSSFPAFQYAVFPTVMSAVTPNSSLFVFPFY